MSLQKPCGLASFFMGIFTLAPKVLKETTQANCRAYDKRYSEMKFRSLSFIAVVIWTGQKGKGGQGRDAHHPKERGSVQSTVTSFLGNQF